MLYKFNLVSVASKAASTGDRFGELIVLAVGRDPAKKKVYAICQCLCGSDPKKVRTDHLKPGGTVSCGSCIHTTHGGTKDGHGKRWANMMARCYDPKSHAYSRYGGRGITVCDRWHDIKSYIKDISPGHFKGAELDRIENDKGYSPDNTRWATSKENNNNRCDTIRLELNGITDTVTGWSERTGIKRADIWQRINNYGWSVERALTEKPGDRSAQKAAAAKTAELKAEKDKARIANQPRVEYDGKKYTMRELSDLCGVKIDLLRKRINERKWPVEKAIQNTNHKFQKSKVDL